MAWFKKDKKPKAIRESRERSTVPEGLWLRCDGCREIVYSKELEKNFRICPKCGFHFRIDAPTRIALLLDEGTEKELFSSIRPSDPLEFADTKRYADRLKAYQKALGVHDAAIVNEGELAKIPVVLAVMDYRFMGGSMGSVVGEKLTLAAERSLETGRPLLIVSASAGARMQEGVLARADGEISTALTLRLREKGDPSCRSSPIHDRRRPRPGRDARRPQHRRTGCAHRLASPRGHRRRRSARVSRRAFSRSEFLLGGSSLRSAPRAQGDRRRCLRRLAS
ncbi:MAG: acetyl-CoA carboxylase carboxyltransferase subunit beta [Thermoanaerobaculia bacterium]